MSLAYVPPGVTVQELTSPSIAPLLAIPGSVCLVGLSSGVLTRTDLITLNGTTVVTLPGVPTDATMASGAIQLIIDAINPSIAPNGYASSTDYTFNASNHTIVRQVTANTNTGAILAAATSFTLTSGSPAPAIGQVIRITDTGSNPLTETATVANVAGTAVTLAAPLVNPYHTGSAITWGPIPDGNSVYVTYNYTPSDYFQPIRLNSMADIQNRFGNAWDTTNTTINSPLSFAASLAFQNGASNIVLQPVYNVTNGVRVQPNATQAASPTIWSTVFTGLLDLEDINIVVPVVGQSQANVNDAVMLQIEEVCQDFVFQMLNGEDRYVIGIVGEDSSASNSVAQATVLRAHAQTLAPRYNQVVTEQMVFINTSQFSVANATSSFLVGAQYASAAIAGMLAARQPADTLTRQVVAGLLSVTDTRSKAAKNTDAATGMMVVESHGQVVQVRHGITMDATNSATRELNVVRSKHFIVESVRGTLDQQVIGKLVADANAPTTVNNLVIATLEDLRVLGALAAYTNVESRITTLDPTAMEVRFSYSPEFVVNYVNVAFSLNLTAQTILVTANGTSA